MEKHSKTCSTHGEQQFSEAVIQRILERPCCSSSQHSSVPTAAIEDGCIHCPSCCSPEAKSRELSFLSSSSFCSCCPDSFLHMMKRWPAALLGEDLLCVHKLSPAPEPHGHPLCKRQHTFWSATNTTVGGVHLRRDGELNRCSFYISLVESQHFMALVLGPLLFHLTKKWWNVGRDGWKGPGPNPNELKGMTPSDKWTLH